MPKYSLQFENITKRFNGVPAVNHLSAQFPEGCIYGFLGPNGSGKTTTMRMILDIIKPDSGSITVLGRSLIARVRDRIGYMPEERGTYGKMSVIRFLVFYGTIKGTSRRRLKRSIHKWIERVGLAHVAGRKVETLSRGMQQKVQFITTVINSPKLVILDEPFSGLDPVNLDILKTIMLRLRRQGKTVIFSTHMMDQAEKLCDFILLLNRGEKLYDGTINRIKSQYTVNTVSLDMEGDPRLVTTLGMVEDVAPNGPRIEVRLKRNTDPQAFLRALVMKTRVRAYEVKLPTLHEIFVDIVGRHT